MVTVLIAMVIIILLVIFQDIWWQVFRFACAMVILAALSIGILTVIGVEVWPL